ncbi:hypothetical protein [Crenothrix sp.]|uniref:Cap15 family cyclic dinucleotide receptor domain-containing protein n=1 Tax=Crenothrix sp. TaxID=3100433 RepID=UPI00374C8E2D
MPNGESALQLLLIAVYRIPKLFLLLFYCFIFMLSKLHLTTLLIISALVGGIVLLANGVAVKISWLSAVSATITVISLLLLGFQKWFWRWRCLHGWFVEKPDVRGTWKVTLKSTWKDPNTGESPPEIEAYLAVRQTYSQLSFRLMTAEQNSELISSTIQRAEDGLYKISGIYRSEPLLSIRERSPIHFGAMIVTVIGDPPSGLNGHYWTDRNSSGEFNATMKKEDLYSDYVSAKSAFEAIDNG